MALAVVCASTSAAVVHTTGDGLGNADAPTNDPGFALVGSSSNFLSGVYVGNGWVLTAHHVGTPSFEFLGISHASIPGSRVQLETQPGVGADLALVRLETLPILPAVEIASQGPAVGEIVDMIGNGWGREPNLTCWNSSFVEVTCPPGQNPSVAFGYKRLSSQIDIRWGRNEVHEIEREETVGNRTTRFFTSRFDMNGIVEEAQTVPGDSGGAVFLERPGGWELVGINFGQTLYEGQPDGTAIFGALSLMVDLAFYRDQIEAVVEPPAVATWPALSACLCSLGIIALAARRLRFKSRR